MDDGHFFNFQLCAAGRPGRWRAVRHVLHLGAEAVLIDVRRTDKLRVTEARGGFGVRAGYCEANICPEPLM